MKLRRPTTQIILARPRNESRLTFTVTPITDPDTGAHLGAACSATADYGDSDEGVSVGLDEQSMRRLYHWLHTGEEPTIDAVLPDPPGWIPDDLRAQHFEVTPSRVYVTNTDGAVWSLSDTTSGFDPDHTMAPVERIVIAARLRAWADQIDPR